MKNLKSYMIESLENITINEAFQCTWLNKLEKTFAKMNDDYKKAMEQCNAEGWWSKPQMSSYNSFKAILTSINMQAGVSGIRWDKITDADITTYKPKNGPFKDFLNDIWKGKKHGIIFGVNDEDYVCCVYVNNTLFQFDTESRKFGYKKSGHKIYKGDLKDYIKNNCVTCGILEFDATNDPKGLLIKDNDPDSKSSRAAAQAGVVRNDKEYYREIARGNRERWEKTIRSNKVKNKDFTKFESRITKIIYDFAEIDPFAFMDDGTRFNMYNETLRIINNRSSYSSESLISLYYRLRGVFKDAETGNDTYSLRQLEQIEQLLEHRLLEAEEMMKNLRAAE